MDRIIEEPRADARGSVQPSRPFEFLQPPSFTTGMACSERARSFDVLGSLVPLGVPELFVASDLVGILGALAALESLNAASLAVDGLSWLALEALSSCTSPLDAWFVLAPGVTLPVRGTQGAALVTPVEGLVRALALSAGRLPDTVVVRLPVVVVSAPTPAAPFVALSPVKRLSGLVDVLFGTVLEGTPAVLPASVGVFVVAGAAVVAPLVLVVAVVSDFMAPLAPVDVDEALPLTCIGGQGVPVERCPALPPVSCCALAPTAMAVLNSTAMPAIRHRTIRSVNSVELVMTTS
jgi:hypothetical protein